MAIAAGAVFVLLRILVPALPDERTSMPLTTLVRSETRAFRDRRLWLALGTTAAFQAAVFCTFSYLAPMLTGVSGISEGYVSLVLLLFGVGTFVGVTIGARYADRDMLANVVLSLLRQVADQVNETPTRGTQCQRAIGAPSWSVRAVGWDMRSRPT